jgi:hypothetical protein
MICCAGQDATIGQLDIIHSRLASLPARLHLTETLAGPDQISNGYLFNRPFSSIRRNHRALDKTSVTVLVPRSRGVVILIECGMLDPVVPQEQVLQRLPHR